MVQLIDLGRDVTVERFVDSFRENDADIIGVSALMTTTMWGQKAIVEATNTRDYGPGRLRRGTMQQEWVQSFGGDLYCHNGAEVVELVDVLMDKVGSDRGRTVGVSSEKNLRLEKDGGPATHVIPSK